MKVVIYGAGGTGRRLCKQLYDRYEVIAFMDTDKRKQNTIIDGIPCISEKEIKELSYDKIVIGAASGYSEIVEKLHDLGVSDSVIDRSFVGARVEARRMFLERYAEICDFLNNPRVAVAEAGVFRGEFAKDINRVFRQNDIFLYDMRKPQKNRNKECCYDEVRYRYGEAVSSAKIILTLLKSVCFRSNRRHSFVRSGVL